MEAALAQQEEGGAQGARARGRKWTDAARRPAMQRDNPETRAAGVLGRDSFLGKLRASHVVESVRCCSAMRWRALRRMRCMLSRTLTTCTTITARTQSRRVVWFATEMELYFVFTSCQEEPTESKRAAKRAQRMQVEQAQVRSGVVGRSRAEHG